MYPIPVIASQPGHSSHEQEKKAEIEPKPAPAPELVLKQNEVTGTKRKYQKVTAEMGKKIAKLMPAIEKGKLTKTDAAKKCGLLLTTFSNALEKLQSGEEVTYRRPAKRVTATALAKVKDLLELINSGELDKKDAAEQCDLSVHTLNELIGKLNRGEDIILHRQNQKVTDETVKKVKEVLFQTEGENLTQHELAKKCQLHCNTFSKIVNDLEENRNPVRLPHKVGAVKFEGLAEKIKANRLARKVKELLSQIKEGKLTQKAAAEQLEISETTFQEIAEKSQNKGS